MVVLQTRTRVPSTLAFRSPSSCPIGSTVPHNLPALDVHVSRYPSLVRKSCNGCPNSDPAFFHSWYPLTVICFAAVHSSNSAPPQHHHARTCHPKPNGSVCPTLLDVSLLTPSSAVVRRGPNTSSFFWTRLEELQWYLTAHAAIMAASLPLLRPGVSSTPILKSSCWRLSQLSRIIVTFSVETRRGVPMTL